ncbi:MAG: BON domain-containing protein [Tahibacter sp.]
MKNDRMLQEDVIAELGWDPAVDAARIGVEVINGIVTLAGHVDSYAQKWAAERAAQRVAGIKGLAIELAVVLPGSHQRTDADIAAAARTSLEWSVSVPGNVDVVVEGGWVTLTGEVEWSYSRTVAENCVRYLIGVKGVINGIVVKPKTSVHDVKLKIESALQRRAHRDSKAIAVHVVDGTVTLSGAIDSWAERDAVEQAAWNAPGVHNVIDKLTLGV